MEIRPAITLGEYKGLDVQHAPTPVTDENVETALEQMREHHAELRSVERPAAPGDVVIVDYTLSPEGLAAEQRERLRLPGRRGQRCCPEIDQAVVGMRAGEEREVGVRFSAEHRREELRDKPGRAAVKVVGGQGEGPPRAGRRLRQAGRRVRHPGRRARRAAPPARGAPRARGQAGPGGQDRRGRCWPATSFPCPTPW